MLIIVLCLVVLALVLLVVFIIMSRRRRVGQIRRQTMGEAGMVMRSSAESAAAKQFARRFQYSNFDLRGLECDFGLKANTSTTSRNYGFGTGYCRGEELGSTTRALLLKKPASSNLNANTELLVEGRLLQALQHPHVVRLLEHVSNPLCLVIEWAEEGNLRKFLRSSRPTKQVGQTALSSKDLTHIIIQVASGLH